MSLGNRLLVAFESLIGLYIGGKLVSPVGLYVFGAIFGIAFSGVGSGVPVISPKWSPTVMHALAAGFAIFATTVFLLTSGGAVLAASRWHKAPRASAPAVALGTVLSFYAAIPVFILGPSSWRDLFSPPLALTVTTLAGALAGTLPVRRGRVSPWLIACVALVVVSPLGIELQWRLLQRSLTPRSAKQEQPFEPPPLSRDIVRTEAFGLTLVAVARDGTLYYDDAAGQLHACTPSGADVWVHDTGDRQRRFGRGAVGADEALYAPRDAHVYAFGQHGGLLWAYDSAAQDPPRILAVAADGTLYIGVDGVERSLRALAPDGVEKWRVNEAARAVSIGADGVLFVAGNRTLSAFTAEGQRHWSIEVDFLGQPAIGEDGTLYVATPRNVMAIGSDGRTRWTTDITPYRSHIPETPVIGADGTLYVVNSDLWAVSVDGVVKWTWWPPGTSPLSQSPLLASDGTIVVTSMDGKVYAITPAGKLRWVHEGRFQVETMTQAADGVIHLALEKEIVSLAVQRMAPSPGPWPQARRDSQNTSRAGSHPAR